MYIQIIRTTTLTVGEKNYPSLFMTPLETSAPSSKVPPFSCVPQRRPQNHLTPRNARDPSTVPRFEVLLGSTANARASCFPTFFFSWEINAAAQ